MNINKVINIAKVIKHQSNIYNSIHCRFLSGYLFQLLYVI